MSNIIPFLFNAQGKTHEVRAVVIDGEDCFVGNDICSVLGYANHSDAISKHCRGVAKRYPILDNLGRMQETRVLTEGDVLRLIVKSTLPAAIEFERWVFEEVLPTIRKTGSYRVDTPSVDQSRLNGALAIAECYTRLLRPAPSSQVAMLANIAKDYGISPAFLPSYVVDAAPDSNAGSSMETKSLTELLKEHKVAGGPAKFNEQLAQAGFIREVTRKSSSAPSGTKTFWSITDAGLRYGKNLTSPQNPRESAPRWYVERFSELHSAVMERVAEAQQ